MVLPPQTSLTQAHDVGEAAQYAIEELEGVDRFVSFSSVLQPDEIDALTVLPTLPSSPVEPSFISSSLPFLPLLHHFTPSYLDVSF